MKAIFGHPHFNVRYGLAKAEDFVPGAKFLVIDIRRRVNASIDIEDHGQHIVIESVSEQTMMVYYYRLIKDGTDCAVPGSRELCFVPIKNFFRPDSYSVVLKERVHTNVVSFRKTA